MWEIQNCERAKIFERELIMVERSFGRCSASRAAHGLGVSENLRPVPEKFAPAYFGVNAAKAALWQSASSVLDVLSECAKAQIDFSVIESVSVNVIHKRSSFGVQQESMERYPIALNPGPRVTASNMPTVRENTRRIFKINDRNRSL